MAISSTYYLNAPSLGSATAVFTNSTLATLAADGFYSDGVISREQVSGVLLPQQECIPAPTTGSITISFNSFDKSFTILSTVPVPQTVFVGSVAVDGYPNNTCGAGTAVAGATLTGGILGLNVTGMVDSKPSTTFSGTWGTTTPYSFSSLTIPLVINGGSTVAYANGATVTISGILFTIYIGKTCL